MSSDCSGTEVDSCGFHFLNMCEPRYSRRGFSREETWILISERENESFSSLVLKCYYLKQAVPIQSVFHTSVSLNFYTPFKNKLLLAVNTCLRDVPVLTAAKSEAISRIRCTLKDCLG